MKVIRVHITSWVASFRNPLFISGFQPTLAIPPLSTIYGLLTAVKGTWVTPHHAAVGFVFQSNGKAVDLETVYEFKGKSRSKEIRLDDVKPNITRREFLVTPNLFLYTPDTSLRETFERPHYPLLLGRSTELATVASIAEIELQKVSQTTYQDTLIPFPHPQIHGQVQALPTHFTAEIPRKPLGTRAYCLVTEKINYQGEAYHDPEKNWGVYLHERIPGDFHVPIERSPRTSKPVDKDFNIDTVDGEQLIFPGI